MATVAIQSPEEAAAVPAPTGDTPALTGDTPAPTGDTLAPTGDIPAPTGDTLAPTGDIPALTGDTPAPTGDTLAPTGDIPAPEPTDAMRARAERNRQRARALRQERAAAAPHPAAAPAPPVPDTGGGFLPEPEPGPAPRAAPRPAPLVDPAERPSCLDCGRGIALSYLLDTFGYAVCDDCRDAEGAHSLVTRTEAKAEYLLRDCDLDARSPPLPHVRRRNPHHARSDMRLYLRAQVEARALLVWGDAARLEAEAARRGGAREAGRGRREARRLRALRMDARSSLFRAPRAAHRHEFGAETYDAAADLYSRVCACGHAQTYEKM